MTSLMRQLVQDLDFFLPLLCQLLRQTICNLAKVSKQFQLIEGICLMLIQLCIDSSTVAAYYTLAKFQLDYENVGAPMLSTVINSALIFDDMLLLERSF